MPNIKDIFKPYMDDYFLDPKIAGTSVKIDYSELCFFEFDSSTDGEASLCTIKWASYCYNSNKKFKLNDDFSKIKLGSKFEVSGGYKGSSVKDKIFSGFVFSSSVEVKDSISYIGVSGMDAKVWLMSNKVTNFKGIEQKYSEIVKKILSNYSSRSSGMEVKISDEPNAIRPGIYQNNESDFEYLRRIADMTGSFFYVLDGKFMFTSVGPNSSPKLNISSLGTVSDDGVIKNIKFTSNLVGIPKSMSINFTSNEEYSKDPQKTKVKSSKKIGKGKLADDITSNISDKNSIDFIDFNISSPENAKFIANSIYRKKSLNFITCEIVCNFLPTAKVGSPAEVSGFGFPLDNNYVITSVNHKFEGKKILTTLKLSSDSFPNSPLLGNFSLF